MVFGCLGRPKSLKSQKCNREPIFWHFLAKVTIYYACNCYFRSKWSQMAQKCTFGAKVPFPPLSPGGLQKRYACKQIQPVAQILPILAKMC